MVYGPEAVACEPGLLISTSFGSGRYMANSQSSRLQGRVLQRRGLGVASSMCYPFLEGRGNPSGCSGTVGLMTPSIC